MIDMVVDRKDLKKTLDRLSDADMSYDDTIAYLFGSRNMA